MTPEDMAEKIVRYEWQSVAELASLLGTWQGQVRKECADRAMEWYQESLTLDNPSALRAAIMGGGSVTELKDISKMKVRMGNPCSQRGENMTSQGGRNDLKEYV